MLKSNPTFSLPLVPLSKAQARALCASAHGAPSAIGAPALWYSKLVRQARLADTYARMSRMGLIRD